MTKRKQTKHWDDVLRGIRDPERYDPKARSVGGPWRMVKCKDGAYVCYELYLEVMENLRKNAEINPAQSPHDGIHTCSKGCNKPGCNRGLRDTIEEQDAQIEALKQDLLEQTAAVRHLRMERVHDLNHIGSQQEELADLRSQFANSEWQPIETAPKDGSLIIGWSDDFTDPVRATWTCLHQWDDPKDVFGWVEVDGDWSTSVKMTHWMPLPKPPAK